MPLQTVHIRINDAGTGQPTPVRLRVTDSAGTYYAPFGHAAEIPTGRGEAVGGDVVVNGDRWATIDGACEIAIPPGELTVQATKGPEYRPRHETIYLPVGKMALRFALERVKDMRKDGWYSGDTRAHFLTPHSALLEAAAEDLAIVHILAGATPMLAADGQTYLTFSNLDAFSGQLAAVERDGSCVVVGTHNKHPVLGELALLHSHRVVYPLMFGGADATDDWSLGDWCDQCHRKRGLVVWTNAAPSPVGHAAEALAHAILGHIDAIELSPERPDALQVWYQLLSTGCRLPLVGASAKRSNAIALGAWRTYARLGDAMNPTTWIEAIRAGRTCASTAALLRLTAAGNESGAVVEKQSDEPIRLQVEESGFDKVELIWNSQVIASGSEAVATSTSLSTSGWLAARAWSADRKRLLAHTSPIWVRIQDAPIPHNSGAIAALRRHLEVGRDWVECEGRFEQPKSRENLLHVFADALAKLVTDAE